MDAILQACLHCLVPTSSFCTSGNSTSVHGMCNRMCSVEIREILLSQPSTHGFVHDELHALLYEVGCSVASQRSTTRRVNLRLSGWRRSLNQASSAAPAGTPPWQTLGPLFALWMWWCQSNPMPMRGLECHYLREVGSVKRLVNRK